VTEKSEAKTEKWYHDKVILDTPEKVIEGVMEESKIESLVQLTDIKELENEEATARKERT
jgi:hypothetical protein